jgi:hypothetical protein
MTFCIKCHAPRSPGHRCNRALLRIRRVAAALIIATAVAFNATPHVNASTIDVGAYSDPADGHEQIYIPIPDCATVAYDATARVVTINLDGCS